MPILNYTTQIASEKTVTEIQGILATHGACAIMNEYEERVLSAVSFRLKTQFGILTYRLPANIEKVLRVLQKQRVTPKLQTTEQASRVAWRILKDWIEAQCALIQSQMVTIDQVFLPYAQHPETGKTVYETLTEGKFAGLALTNGK